MKIRKFFFRLVQSADIFGTNKFFRYRSESRLKSLFGGIVSVLVIIALAVAIYHRFMEFYYRVNIYSSQSKIVQKVQPQLDMSTYPKGKFMAAIAVADLDLNDPVVKYLDGKSFFFSYTFGTQPNANKQIMLEKCTNAHWDGFPQIAQDLKLVNITKMLCLPKDLTLKLQGNINDEKMQLFNMFLQKIKDIQCPPNGSFPRCATAAQKLQFFGNNKRHKFQLYFTNYQISPNKPDHIQVFLDDRNFGYFTEKLGSLVSLYFQDYLVQTEQGVEFFEYTITQTGGLVEQDPTTFQYAIATRFCQFIFQKSMISRTYQRRYGKLQDVFSFIGGLLRAVYMTFIIIRFYNRSAYSINLGSELFITDQVEQKKFFKNYKFISYVRQGIYNLLSRFSVKTQWKATIQYERCENQVIRYVDILYIIKRLVFLENAISVILEKHQEMGLHLREKLSVDQTYKKRQMSYIKRKLNRIRQTGFMQETDLVLGLQGLPPNSLKLKSQTSYSNKIIVQSLEQSKEISKKNILSRLESKLSQLHDQMSDESQDYDYNRKHNVIHKEFLQDLTKVQKEAKKDKRISKNIMRLSGLMIPAIQMPIFNEQKNQSSVSELISQVEQKNNKKPNNKLAGKKRWVEENQVEESIKNEVGSQQKPKQIKKNAEKCSKCKPLSSIRRFIEKMDIFSAKKLLRFESELNHKTFLGGLISLCMFTFLILISYQKMIDCIDKTTIYSKQTKIFSNDPMFVEIQTYPKGNFMASLELNKVDLSKDRIFNYSLENIIRRFNESTGEWNTQVTSHQLEPCTTDHWGNNPQILKSMNLSLLSRYLCLPMGISFSIQGRKSSKQFRTAQLVVSPCTGQALASGVCSQSKVDSFFSYNEDKYYSFRVVNAVLNPQSSDPIQYYLDQTTILFITVDFISIGSVYLTDYTITTDESIFPWTSKNVTNGTMITQNIDIVSFDNVKNPQGYIRVKLLKSFDTVLSERSFKKIQYVFAFIGGMFKVIYSALFLVTVYNTLAYEITLSSKLFKPKKNYDLFKKYNIFDFIRHATYSFLCSLGFSPQWELTIEENQFHHEMKKQLDIASILKKLDFLECSISTVLETYEVMGLRLTENPSIDQAKQKRRAFRLKKKIHKLVQMIGQSQKSIELPKENLIKSETKTDTSNSILDLIKEAEMVDKDIQTNLKRTRSTMGSNLALLDDKKDGDLQLEDPEEIISSDSQSESDNEIAQAQIERERILQEVLKLEKDAKEGDLISQKIVNLVSQPVLARLVKNLRNFGSRDRKMTKRKAKTILIFDVSEVNQQNELDDDIIIYSKVNKKDLRMGPSID